MSRVLLSAPRVTRTTLARLNQSNQEQNRPLNIKPSDEIQTTTDLPLHPGNAPASAVNEDLGGFDIFQLLSESPKTGSLKHSGFNSVSFEGKLSFILQL